MYVGVRRFGCTLYVLYLLYNGVSSLYDIYVYHSAHMLRIYIVLPRCFAEDGPRMSKTFDNVARALLLFTTDHQGAKVNMKYISFCYIVAQQIPVIHIDM